MWTRELWSRWWSAIWCHHAENSLTSLVKLHTHCGRLYSCSQRTSFLYRALPCVLHPALLSSDSVVWLTLAYKIWMDIMRITFEKLLVASWCVPWSFPSGTTLTCPLVLRRGKRGAQSQSTDATHAARESGRLHSLSCWDLLLFNYPPDILLFTHTHTL